MTDNQIIRHVASVDSTDNPNIGTKWIVVLGHHTEDGYQRDYVGEYFDERDAELVASAWRSNILREFLHLGASLSSGYPGGEDQQAMDNAECPEFCDRCGKEFSTYDELDRHIHQYHN